METVGNIVRGCAEHNLIITIVRAILQGGIVKIETFLIQGDFKGYRLLAFDLYTAVALQLLEGAYDNKTRLIYTMC